jgi:putative RNA 2'-phosphotransferase
MGLSPNPRLYVHLSLNYDTALKVGNRHGKYYIYQVDAKKMNDDGFDFFISVNGVWLTKTVPVEYLKSVTSGRFS